MGYTLTAVELHYLVKEWQSLIGAKMDKIYQNNGIISIKMHKTKIGGFFLNFNMPSALYVSEKNQASAEKLPHFAEYLRKYLINARVRSISQFSKRERIIEIELEKEEVYRLIIELLPPGNVIFCAKDYRVMMPLHPKRYSNRVVRPNAPYQKVGRKDLSKSDFIELFKKSQKTLVKTLAIDCSLAGTYAEEVCNTLNLDKAKDLKDLDDTAILEIYKSYNEIFNQEIDVHIDDEHAYPFKIKTKDVKKTDDTFALAIGKLIPKDLGPKEDKSIIKQKSIILKQEESLDILKEQITDNARKGELLYEHYTEITQLYNALKNKEDVNKQRFPFLKKYNRSTNTAELEFD